MNSTFNFNINVLVYCVQGLKTAEKNNLINLFQPHNPSFVIGAHTSSPKHDTSNVRKLDNLIKKFN